MALDQALTLTRNLYSTLQAPLTSTQICSTCPKSITVSLPPLKQNSKHLTGITNRRLRCLADHNNGHYNNGVSYPRPPEIPWKKELCNSINLIGIVAKPVEIKHLPSGKVVASARLAVKNSPTNTSWINLTFWDELAHVAFQHVEKGQQIYVSGRLVSDVVANDEGKQQTYYKVVVQQLNFVERSFSSVTLYDRETNSMTSGRKLGNHTGNNMGSTEELWQAFFANPVDWWDNRKNKRNPKYPDFKHKDTGEALWVEGRNNPPWVKSQLAILDSTMELHDHDSIMHTNFRPGDNFMPF